MWAQLGLFSGMICVGSVAGCVAWGARLQNLNIYYESQDTGLTRQQHFILLASSHQWLAVFLFMYGLEFLFLAAAKLVLLGRLARSAALGSQEEDESMDVRRGCLKGRALPVVYRVISSAVVVGCVVGMVANVVAVAFLVQAIGLEQKAADACHNNTLSCRTLGQEVVDKNAKVRTAQSVQAVSEALTLLLLSVAFIAIVSWSVALFRMLEHTAAHALRSAKATTHLRPSEEIAARIVENSMHGALQQRQRLITTCVIVLATFPARAVFDCLNAYSSFNAPLNSACAICDGSCQSDAFLIREWINYTPEFQALVVALSSPLPLTVTLWLITKAHAQLRLIAADVQLASQRGGL